MYFEKNRIVCFRDHIGRHLGFLRSPSVMPIYAGSFRNYKHYRTFWYITHLVLRGGPGSQIFGPDCHPTNTRKEQNEPRHDKTNNVAVRLAKTEISLDIHPV